MTTPNATLPDGATTSRSGVVRPRQDATTVVEAVRLPEALRASARRRKVRASSLRAWSEEVRPVLGRSLCRRAAELELGAVALELRADGMDGGAPSTPHDEEDR